MTKPEGVRFDPAIELDLCHVTVAPPFVKTMAGVMKEFDWLSDVVAQHDNVRWVRNAMDLEFPGLKLVGGLQYPPEDATVEDMHFLRGDGILFMTLAYEEDSPFGGGFAVPEAHLTARGRELLRRMADAGMVLDLSHAGWTTAHEALDTIQEEGLLLPVVASHSGCSRVYSHLRNLPDGILIRIRDMNGIVGIPTATFMLDEKDDTVAPFLRHIQYAVGLLGPDAVAIGSDGIYKELNLEEMQQLFATMKEKIDPRGNFKARFPDQPIELNSPARMRLLAEKLEQAYGRNDLVEKVAGENLFNFLRGVL